MSLRLHKFIITLADRSRHFTVVNVTVMASSSVFLALVTLFYFLAFRFGILNTNTVVIFYL